MPDGNTKAHNLYEIYEHGDEKQVNFLRETSFKVTKTEKTNGSDYVKIHLEEIDKVEAFKEKPDLATVEKYIQAGNYYWNAGIFVWNINTISKAIRTFQPKLANIMDEMSASFYTDNENEVLCRLFPTCDKISIDYAVMEKSTDIYTLPAEFGWSDLGSWGSLHTLLSQDEDGNAKIGKDIRLYDCQNCVVHAADESKVVVQGLDGYIVAEKNGQLLVCSLKEEQRIKDFEKFSKKKSLEL